MQFKVVHVLGIGGTMSHPHTRSFVQIQGDDVLQFRLTPVLVFGYNVINSNTRWWYFAIQVCHCIGLWMDYIMSQQYKQEGNKFLRKVTIFGNSRFSLYGFGYITSQCMVKNSNSRRWYFAIQGRSTLYLSIVLVKSTYKIIVKHDDDYIWLSLFVVYDDPEKIYFQNSKKFAFCLSGGILCHLNYSVLSV